MSSPAQQMVFISNFGMIRVGEDFGSGAGSNRLRKLPRYRRSSAVKVKRVNDFGSLEHLSDP